MAQKNMKVLVYGATGSQGSPVVTQLLKHGHQPYVLTRHPHKAATLQQAGAQIVAGDMGDAASLRRASEGMDAVSLLIPFFLANPLDAPAYGHNAIRAAQDAGVKLVVWNPSGLIPPQPTGNPGVDVRVEVKAALEESGIPFIIIEPTGYMENLLGPWTAPSVANNDKVTYPNTVETRIGWIASEDVGALVVAALERPELANTIFQVSGLENLNGTELAERFSQALNRPVSYCAMEPEEFGAVLDRMFGPGAGELAASEYRKMRDNPNPPPMFHAMQPVLEKLPVKMTPLAEWVAYHKEVFSTI